MTAEIVIMSIVLVFMVVLLGGLVFLFKVYLDVRNQVTMGIIKKIIKPTTNNKEQKAMDELVFSDVHTFIDENPVLIDIFPDSIPKALESSGRKFPTWLASIAKIVAPMAGQAITTGETPALSIGTILGNPELLQGILSFLGKVRSNAKENHTKKEITTPKNPVRKSKGIIKADGLG